MSTDADEATPPVQESGERTWRSTFRKARATLYTALVALAVLFAAVMLVPAVLGYQRYVITGKSMTGTYDRGSVVFDEVVAPSELRIGDVITYTPPPGSGPTGRVTHRIVSIRHSAKGERAYRTKGDANQAIDPWKFTLSNREQARVVGHLPYVGYGFAWLSDPHTRFLVIGIPALLVALSVFFGFLSDAKREAAEEASSSTNVEEGQQ
jgi:signal peptidase I